MREKLLLLLLVLCPVAWSLMVARCPEGWVSRGGTDQCYLIHNNGKDRSFNDARIYCQAHAGDLAIIGSFDMRDWLAQALAETGEVGQNAYMWVGARYVDGEWTWVEVNEPVSNTILPWEGAGSGDCAAFTANSKLIKQDCSQQLKFVCHRNITVPPPCDSDAHWEEFHDHCYKKSTSMDSWHDAQVACDTEGSSLVSITGEAEQQLVAGFAVDANYNVWTGLTEEGHAGTFTWIDGTPVNYTNWHLDQPDLSLGGYGAAVVDNDYASGMWEVERITDEFHYMCKKAQGACLPGWEVFEESCYYFNTEEEDMAVWDDASSTCQAVGASLVVLDSKREDKFFRNHMPETDQLWIGLFSIPSEDFFWTDGSSMSSKNFTYISDENHDAAVDSPDRQCVFFQLTESPDTTPTSSWVPTDCFMPHHYACEVPAGQPVNLIPPSNERFCPEDWVSDGYFCYMFVAEEATWTGARAQCKKLEADLISVTTWAEQDFVHNNMLSGGWIGFNDRAQSDVWTWSDGSSARITNWNTGEPSGGNENCAEMQVETGKWNDISCYWKLAYGCKRKDSLKPIVPPTTTTPLPDYSNCGWDWTENYVTGECYRLEMEELSFQDARLQCRELDHSSDESRPDLLSVYSAEEQTFISDLVSSQHLSQSTLWLGMMNDVDGDRWLDGTPVAYFNWNDGEPNSVYYENCIEMYSEGGKWNDVDCEMRRAFICEKKGKNYVGPTLPPPPEVRCPQGWNFWDNHCYLFSSDMTDWDSAHAWCEDNMGSELASITSQDEHDYVNGVLESYWRNGWIGLHDNDNGGEWHWTDGSPLEYTNWLDGEPNNANGNEHCAEMRSGDYYYSGKWNDMPCFTSNYYVCKTTVKTCPQSWTYHEEKCYYTSNFEVTWNEARDKCKEFNTDADLVSIHSDEENDFFLGELTQSSVATWLGLTYDPDIQLWAWSDGQDANYTNWNEGEPNNLDTEWCTECIDFPGGDTNGKWNNLACTDSRAFGCEFFPTHTVGCEEGWVAFDQYCYWYNADTPMDSFSGARASCQKMGGDLVSIHTAEENDFVFSLPGTATYDNTWIGITEEGHPGSFSWTDGTSVTFTKWETLGLSTSIYSSCGAYAFYFYESNWELLDCDWGQNYICKKPQESRPINPPPQDGCSEGDEEHKGSCYNFPGTYLSWSEAESLCEGRDAHLLVINDRFENAFISAYLGDLGSRAWIGLSGTVGADGSVTFSWVNQDPVDFTNWDEYEPDPEHGTCVAASGERTNPGLWTVKNCEELFQFICEYDRPGYTPPPPLTTLPPPPTCIYGWNHKGSACYKVFPEPSTWGLAEQFCASFGGHLTSVGSAEEQTLIQELPGMSSINDTYQSVWVGLKLGSDTGYEWTDGTAFDYVDWAEGQPDSHYGREDCVLADKSSLKLSDSVCDAYQPFICKAAQGTMVTTIAPPTKPSSIMCQDDPSWYLYEDHCYKFVSVSEEGPQTWLTSHKRCRDVGAELASIHSYEENYWIESMIYGYSDNSFWIGGRAMLDSGFLWEDGSPFDFENWAKGEPNNLFDQENCAAMYNHNQGYWNDQNCGQLEGHICKRQHGATLPPHHTTPLPDGHCPLGWLHLGTNCLKFNTEKRNFSSARTACTDLLPKADMISVHSSAEQAYVSAALGVLQENMWLGMRYQNGFLWVDQSEVTYTNWAPGEPNGATQGEECVEVIASTGQWNDLDCSNTLGFVCLMKQDPTLSTHSPGRRCDAPFADYFAYDGACYRSDASPKTWQEAESTCVGEGSHLASVHDLSEDSLMWVMAQENGLTDAWIGLNNLQDKQVFQWTDGWPTVYTNWAGGEPNVSVTDNHCVRLTSSDGRWAAEACNVTRPFICKFRNGTVPTPDPPSTGHCPDTRWIDLGGGYCYLISDLSSPWTDASKSCLQENANLASIHSKEEMQLITMSTQNLQDPLWIGLVQKRDGFGWSDGTGLDFINWEDGEPNSELEECTEVYSANGRWNDADCNTQKQFICKTLKIQNIEPTNPVLPTGPATTLHPGGGTNALGAGGIVGIVIAVLFLMAAVGFIGYSYVQRKPKLADGGETHSFENALYTGGDKRSSSGVRGMDTSDSVRIDSDYVGTEA